MHTRSLSAEAIEALLDQYLEAEYSFRQTAPAAALLADYGRADQEFILDWVKRIASTNIELAFQFAGRVEVVLATEDRAMIEDWALLAMDCYDQKGLRAGLQIIQDAEQFAHYSRQRQFGASFEDRVPVLLPFLRGLSGRALKIEQGEVVYTDSETLYLPALIADFTDREDNARLFKAMVAHLWAQTRFGTFRAPLKTRLAEVDDPEALLARFHALETVRLDACIERSLPGLYRDMRRLRTLFSVPEPIHWANAEMVARLRTPEASADDSLDLALSASLVDAPPPVCYQGCLLPEQVEAVMAQRIEKEKIYVRLALADIAEEHLKAGSRQHDAPRFERREIDDPSQPEGKRYELTIDGRPVALPLEVRNLMTSVVLDFGDIPDEYLEPAGPGEYDPADFAATRLDPDDVWSGAYHEEGAFLYKEWDCQRLGYRKNWCVLRELDVPPDDTGFYQDTLQKHRGLIKSLRRSFEVLRGEDKMLKRQAYGDDIDIDALVEARADLASGMEMTNRLFTRMHKDERSIAVMMMVDMSGSTKGWVNEAERESLILLSESLDILGDRFAVYGFSGTTRKRCEVFRIKTFDEAYAEAVKGRISGIRAREYTRMGVAIRHLSTLLNQVEARTKLLITLSDGKPEDYDGYYRGEYGIQDTRQALFEARRDGVHPFCITIDETARDYLPHLYGPANFVVVKDVRKLPEKVSEIYRKLTR